MVIDASKIGHATTEQASLNKWKTQQLQGT
jgi:hypothetical protein